MESITLAKKIAHLAVDKKAEDIVVLDMRNIVNYCDYFVICTGSASRHVNAIADGIDTGLAELGIKVRFKQGFTSQGRSRGFFLKKSGDEDEVEEENPGHWLLLDMGDVVVHVFEGNSREFYGLEYLWQGAVKIDWTK